METSRRSFIRGAASTLFCAPAIVRASSLMAVRVEKVAQVSLWQVGWEESPIFPPPNRTVRYYFDVKTIRDRNVLLAFDDYAWPGVKLRKIATETSP